MLSQSPNCQLAQNILDKSDNGGDTSENIDIKQTGRQPKQKKTKM